MRCRTGDACTKQPQGGKLKPVAGDKNKKKLTTSINRGLGNNTVECNQLLSKKWQTIHKQGQRTHNVVLSSSPHLREQYIGLRCSLMRSVQAVAPACFSACYVKRCVSNISSKKGFFKTSKTKQYQSNNSSATPVRVLRWCSLMVFFIFFLHTVQLRRSLVSQG